MAPDTAERRPRQGSGVPDDNRGDGITIIVSATQARRRREASLRLGPCGDGPADPLDALAGLPIRVRPYECPGQFGDNGQWRPCCGRQDAA